jgi:hypothetical protein
MRDVDRERVLATFMPAGKLVVIPRRAAKRRVVLDEIVQRFEPGRHYSELEVNDVLRNVHDDTAALRRYLVDGEFLDRAGGEYWRAGGRVET